MTHQTARDAADAAFDTIMPDGRSVRTTPFIGASPVKGGTPINGPQGYLVEQSPHSVIPTHFHLQDQYQVVVHGAGTLGRHAIAAVTVHYANGHNGYGPIVAGDDGLSYFTLREHADTGIYYLPAERESLDTSVPRRQTTTSPVPVIRQNFGVIELIAERADGGGAWSNAAKAGAEVELHGTQNGGGAFHIVLSGSLHLDDTELSSGSLIYTDRNQRQDGQAGSNGVHILSVRFPYRKPL